MKLVSILPTLLALVVAPLLPGIINRVKAFFAGRQGPPLLQAYYDVRKLLRKGAVFSRTTTWVFCAGPVVNLAALLVVSLLLPFGAVPAPAAFPGDLVLVIYLLGLARFFTVLAALDTGSSFEGMGANREMHFALFAEPALILALAALAHRAGVVSLSGIYAALSPAAWVVSGPALALVAATLLAVYLAENARVPVDDPNTHLELTMIHEVMVLDHGGIEFGLITYAAALKLWLLGTLIISLFLPLITANPLGQLLAGLAGQLLLAAMVGGIESCMARLRLVRVPQMLVGAAALAALAFILVLR